MDDYLIWSHEHQGWWCAGEAGYSSNIVEAGWYTKERANEIVTAALDGWHPKEDGSDLLPHEVMVSIGSFSLITAVAEATVMLIRERG